MSDTLRATSAQYGNQIESFEQQIESYKTQIAAHQKSIEELKFAKKIVDDAIAKLPAPKAEKDGARDTGPR